MSDAPAVHLARRYDRAASRWGDKMRTLGYYDAYLGFLCDPAGAHSVRAAPLASSARVFDVGAGTGAMAEAYVAVNGAPRDTVLVDPSPKMLDRAQSALARYGVTAVRWEAGLEVAAVHGPAEVVLAAHLIEHFADPRAALDSLSALLVPGGLLWLVVSKPHWCNAIVWMKWRHRYYDPAGVRALIAGVPLALVSEHAFPSGPPCRTSRGYLCRRVAG